MANSIVALVADHAGFELKNTLKGLLDEQGFETLDLGPESPDPVDYPDMAGKLAGLHVDIVHVRGLRPLAGPDHQSGVLSDHRHHQIRRVAVEDVNRHVYADHNPSYRVGSAGHGPPTNSVPAAVADIR